MSTYGIQIQGIVPAVVEVEADTYEEAVDKAIENAPTTSFAFADFDAVEEWEESGGYYKDGEYISGEEATK